MAVRLANGETIHEFETEWRKKNAHSILVSINAQPVIDETGEIIGASNVVRDITEQKYLEEKLKKAMRTINS